MRHLKAEPGGCSLWGRLRPAAAALVALSASLTVAATPTASIAGPPQNEGVATLRLTAAPVTLEYPAGEAQWARRLAANADAAARALEEIIGRPVPDGRLVWQPRRGADTARGIVAVEAGPPPTVTLHDPLAGLATDHGVAFATGYARWLATYSMARLYGAAAAETWWSEGAALYLTDLIARRERATTPLLYGLESAWVRRARRRLPVELQASPSSEVEAGDAARGKAYLTLRLLEALVGRDAVTAAIGDGASRRVTGAADIAALLGGGERLGTALETWLRPDASIDLGLERVRVERGRISGRVTRAGGVALPAQLEVRLADGSIVPLRVVADQEQTSWEAAVESEPVEVRLDPEGLLPDVNRGNNRHGFGDAARVRSFFPLDDVVEIGELHLEGDIEQVGGERVEEFTVTLENLTDEPVGLGLLVSAQWLSRPANRRQRAIFLTLPPGERREARDFLVYPRLGNERARIEARYWRADDPEALTTRLLRDPADLVNSYLVLRRPAATEIDPEQPYETNDPEIVPVARLAHSDIESLSGSPVPNFAAPAPASDEGQTLSVRIVDPRQGALPVGEMSFEASVDEGDDEVAAVELYVNDRLLASREQPPWRTAWTPSEAEDIFVLRAVAVGASGRLATDTRVLDRSVAGFGASVDLVTLYVTVKDAAGSYVRDLPAAAFRVVEDGVTQEIVDFAQGETPVSVALLLDTSSSMIGGGIRSARGGAKRLVHELLQGHDRAMVLGFNDRLYLYSDFSDEVPALETAIDTTYPDGSTALYDGIVGSLRKVNQGSGKRALVVLSDGLDTQSRFGYADVLEYTRQSDVLVYTIGLQLMHDATEFGDASDDVKKSVDNLRALAEITGGAAYFPLRLKELEDVYSQIAEELASQYALSYYPTNQDWSGRWRQVRVQVPDRATARVQARPGYYGVRPERR